MIDPRLATAFRHHFRRRVATVTKFQGQGSPVPSLALWAMEEARKDVASGVMRHTSERLEYYPDVSWQDRPGEGFAHVSDPRAAGLRYVGKVEPMSRDFTTRDGIGWFTDPDGFHSKDGTGLCWGVVYQLPGRAGRTYLVPGYQMGGEDSGPTLDFGSVMWLEPDGSRLHPEDRRDARDCAGLADQLARRAAEVEREYQTAWSAGSLWRSLGDEMSNIVQTLRKLLRERRTARRAGDAFPTICAAITAQARDMIAEWREARERRAALQDGRDIVLGFSTRDARLVAAFNEGASW